MNCISALQDAIKHKKAVFFDGGMGTLLQSAAVQGWSIPEELNLTHPELIYNIHCDYLNAGCDFITTNSFGANRLKLVDYSYDVRDMVHAAVSIARKAVADVQDCSGKPAYVAFDMGPTGKLLAPMGELSFDDAYACYAESARYAEEAGADVVIIETMSDLYEMKAAVLAVKECTSLAIIACMTFQDSLRTLTGADVATCVSVLESLGVAAVGFNCGGGLKAAQDLCAEFVAAASIPVIVQPNAGIPILEAGQTVFKVLPDEFAQCQKECAERGAYILGGCCGTRPTHIAAMTTLCRTVSCAPLMKKNKTTVSSWCSTLSIGDRPLIIGERINPTGKKRFKQALIEGDLSYIINEGKAQIACGADILDVNVGLPGIDEKEIMCEILRRLQMLCTVPLQIDSSEPSVLEAALRYYNGKALVNSVNGKESVMRAVFPLIQKYGGVVLALTLDENGIPSRSQDRLAIAERIIACAAEYGIERKNIIVDALTLTVASQQKEATETLACVRALKEQLGVHTVLGVSNISFGLPRRDIMNAHFLTAALYAGLDMCIINPLSDEMMNAYYAYCALAGFDEHCLHYIERFSHMNVMPSPSSSPVCVAPLHKTLETSLATAKPHLYDIITKGLKDEAQAVTVSLLETHTPLDIIDTMIIPALDFVGKEFESGKKFLPQLLLSADTVSQSFAVIKDYLERKGEKTASKGTILLATVYGDIHDIGKNIVRAMLENYGYTVVDMGKNVPSKDIVSLVCEQDIRLVGLSALMTTTVINMEQTIQELRQAVPNVKIMVGGAVLTEEYATKIGADFYVKDAMASVAVAKGLFS